jgi:hypothetical protein
LDDKNLLYFGGRLNISPENFSLRSIVNVCVNGWRGRRYPPARCTNKNYKSVPVKKISEMSALLHSRLNNAQIVQKKGMARIDRFFTAN